VVLEGHLELDKILFASFLAIVTQLASFLSWCQKVKNLCFEPHFSPKKTTAMTEQQLLALEEAITALKAKLTGDMFADMEVRDEIHNLEMQLKGVKPLDSHFDCVGCGS
jgi:hypothetical protein